MTCKVCEKGNMVKQGDKLVCDQCGAVAIPVENQQEIKLTKSQLRKEKREKKRKEAEEKEAQKSAGRKVLEFCTPMIVAVIIAAVLRVGVIANATIPTESMYKTIEANDRVIASRLSYTFDEPERGDIIIFEYPEDYAKGITTYYVKRIIGLPGETVTISGGSVYITDTDGNTEMLEEDYVIGRTYEGLLENGTYTVPEDSYFVMGDNRQNSEDSRYWRTTHCVHEDRIIGKVLFKYYPNFEKLD